MLSLRVEGQLIEMVPETSLLPDRYTQQSHGANVFQVREQDQLLTGWLCALAQGYRGGCSGTNQVLTHKPETTHYYCTLF